eukprot:symbB.v1.2.014910.t1/scaffold1101.1/size137853/20
MPGCAWLRYDNMSLGTSARKLYLPSVDRPWPLSCEKAKKVYGFQATPLDDVLAACVDFFEDSCAKFPEEAKKAAMKLPSEPAAYALKFLETSCNPTGQMPSHG